VAALRANAVMATGIESEVLGIAQRMATQKNYEDAWTLGLELQAFGDEGVEGFLLVLREGTLAARRATAFWLSDEAEGIPDEIFLSIAQDPDDDIRFYAAYGLGYSKQGQTLPQLRYLLLNDSSVEVRQTAAYSLYSAAKLNHTIEDIIDDFAKALQKDPSHIVREEIVTTLSYFLGTPAIHKAIYLLELALRDPAPSVVYQAQISLHVLKNEQWRDQVVQ
jgi:HEAT repeat protein